MRNKTLIVLVGGPCSGKSSAGKIAAKNLGAKYISSGDIARDMARYDVDMQMDLDSGKMAPESKMREEISKRLWKCFNKLDMSLIVLDGFPRFGEQAEWLRNEFHTINIKYVLFHAPSWVLRQRAKSRNRSDDGSFGQRLTYYCEITYKELYNYVDTIIDTENMDIGKCAILLEDYIMKEVIGC